MVCSLLLSCGLVRRGHIVGRDNGHVVPPHDSPSPNDADGGPENDAANGRGDDGADLRTVRPISKRVA